MRLCFQGVSFPSRFLCSIKHKRFVFPVEVLSNSVAWLRHHSGHLSLVPSTMASQIPHDDLPPPQFFSKFASVYVQQTGRSTLNILIDVIVNHVQTSRNPIGRDSVVHDTASGPGIGAAAIADILLKDEMPKRILVSDNNAMMIKSARESLSASPLPEVNCQELDSQNLQSIPDDHFTHSINNFSIFLFARPIDGIRETYRTLRPGGLAIVTCWRRFPPMFIVRSAQKKVRPLISDDALMPVAGPEFLEEGILQKVVEEGGFAKAKITTVDKVLVVTEEDRIVGLTMLMSGPLMSKARESFTDEEQGKWGEAIGEAIKEEIALNGGIRFEAYVLLATK